MIVFIEVCTFFTVALFSSMQHTVCTNFFVSELRCPESQRYQSVTNSNSNICVLNTLYSKSSKYSIEISPSRPISVLTDVEIFIVKDFYCIKKFALKFQEKFTFSSCGEIYVATKEQFEQSSIFQHVFIPNYCLARLLLSLVCQDFESFFSCAALSHFCGLSCDTVKPLSVFSLLAHLCCCPGNSLPFLQIFISRNGNLNSF